MQQEKLDFNKVNNAVILAAGTGSRFIPLSYETPKGLLEVFGQPMVERQIEQLLEAGVSDITIVVGHLKEKFEYLMDKYGVELVYNPEYRIKNNLASLYLVREKLKNTYVLSSDNWMRENMFHACEQRPWYSLVYQKGRTSEWCVKMNGDEEITDLAVGGENSCVLYGPVYFTKAFSEKLVPVLEHYYQAPGTEDWYWETVWEKHIGELVLYGNVQSQGQVYEFENLEELRKFDQSYENHSRNKIVEYIAGAMDGGIQEKEITGIVCLKAGMTNESFRFCVRGEEYICRVPGEGTEQLINRTQEAQTYQAVRALNLSDEVIDFNTETGYKISKYYKNARVCHPQNREDLVQAMELIRKLHHSQISVPHDFDIEEKITFYEELCICHHAIRFRDYEAVKGEIQEVLKQMQIQKAKKVLCHVDSVPDNFILLENGEMRLIDWEYAGMGEPLMDVAMYGIYSYYSQQEMDELWNLYTRGQGNPGELQRFYGYVALGGFLWSLWSEYKQALGVDFGMYGMKMYQYAKEYCKKWKETKGETT